MPAESLSLPQVVEQVGALLLGAGIEQANGQVSDVPDLRTIRYYTTIGLVDPPAGHRGRRALYTRNHVEQVVAIKRLQAAGYSLDEIREQLEPLTSTQVRNLAIGKRQVRPAPGAAVPGRSPTDDNPAEGPTERPPNARETTGPTGYRGAPRTVTEIPLQQQLTLVLSGTPELTTSSLRSIRAAAVPLIYELERLGLTGASAVTPPRSRRPRSAPADAPRARIRGT